MVRVREFAGEESCRYGGSRVPSPLPCAQIFQEDAGDARQRDRKQDAEYGVDDAGKADPHEHGANDGDRGNLD